MVVGVATIYPESHRVERRHAAARIPRQAWVRKDGGRCDVRPRQRLNQHLLIGCPPSAQVVVSGALRFAPFPADRGGQPSNPCTTANKIRPRQARNQPLTLSQGHKKIILYGSPGTAGFYGQLGFLGMNTA
jgi:hypothetical protein